jgi:endonuclease-3
MIVSRLAERRRGLVFLLWGKMAQSRARLVDKGAHCVLRAAHPSPLSAQRGFFGCRHFSRCNAYLSSHGKPPIEWALPPLFPAARDPTAPEPAPTSPSKPAGAAVRRSSTDAPPRWREQLDAIEQARAGRDAPVDFLGCHTLGRAADGDEACRFQTLVALILAARSSDVAVADAMQRLRLLVAHDGPVCLETVEALDQTLLLAALSGYPVAVAFPPSKARYILGTCAALRHTHDGRVPRELDELRQLPGVGPKAAHLAQLAMWGKAEGIAVDSHVLRICNRLGWTGPSGPVKSAETARRRVEAWLPRQRWAELNPLLVGFGQQRCSEVEPRCGDCSLMLGELCAGVSRTWGQR